MDLCKERGASMFATIEEALDDLRAGKVIIVVDDENRENEGDFIGLASKVTPEMINFMASEGKGLICVPITKKQAKQLQLPLMTMRNTDPHETAFTVSIDHISTHTGISTFERAETIRQMVKPDATGEQFKRPGHIFPLIAKEGGVMVRPGHTEAAVDLARLANSGEAGVICEILHDDGTMARVPQLQKIAQRFQLKMITIQSLIDYRKRHEILIQREAEIDLPTEYGHFRVIAFSEKVTGKEHLAIVKGNVTTDEQIIVRLHSECLTGDVFQSNRCDCGPQLVKALQTIEVAGKGVVLYLRQEGRGIGLINKLKAYELQEQGLDTVEANEQLGFAADLREYDVAAQMIRDLQIKSVKLLTNNPKKIEGLRHFGIAVNRLAHQLPTKQEHKRYLQTKAEKLGHLLQMEGK